MTSRIVGSMACRIGIMGGWLRFGFAELGVHSFRVQERGEGIDEMSRQE